MEMPLFQFYMDVNPFSSQGICSEMWIAWLAKNKECESLTKEAEATISCEMKMFMLQLWDHFDYMMR